MLKVLYTCFFLLFSLSLSSELTYKIPSSLFLKKIKLILEKKLNSQGFKDKKYKITTLFFSLPENVFLPIDYKIDIQFLDNLSKNCKNVKLRIYIPLGNKTFSIYEGVVCYKTFIKAYAAKTYIKKGEIINKDMIKPTYVSDIQKNFVVTNITQIVGKVAKVNIYPNQVIYKYFLEKPKLVKRGEKLTLVAYNNGIFVELKVLALSSGGKGDYIFVKNLSSGKILKCKIIGKGICLYTNPF